MVWQTNSYQHEYTIKDHLGNARVTYSDANNDGVIAVSDIKQINHYYPFGMNMEGNWNGAAGSNKYQYNGKEWNDDFGLGLNDYGARFYDPAIARWTAVDPLSEKYRRWSPYNYGMNNPIRFNDPTGMSSEAANTGMMRNDGSTHFDRFTMENERKIYGYAQSDVASSISGDKINNNSDTDPYELTFR